MSVIKYIFILPFFCILSLMVGCENNNFKKSCLESRSVMENAINLLVPTFENNKSEIIVRNNNARAVEYINNNKQNIKLHYSIIKNNIIHPSSNYYDAVYAGAYINELYYYITGNVLDDRCYYIKLIDINKNAKLSDWLINDFFAPLKHGENKTTWLDLNPERKKEIILHILSEAKENCKSEQ